MSRNINEIKSQFQKVIIFYQKHHFEMTLNYKNKSDQKYNNSVKKVLVKNCLWTVLSALFSLKNCCKLYKIFVCFRSEESGVISLRMKLEEFISSRRILLRQQRLYSAFRLNNKYTIVARMLESSTIFLITKYIMLEITTLMQIYFLYFYAQLI